eukprot:10478992-Heterocapsa_arctica.AAC.1
MGGLNRQRGRNYNRHWEAQYRRTASELDDESASEDETDDDEEEEDDEEMCLSLIEKTRGMLWAWAGNHNLSDGQKRHCMSELLASWHPDQHRDRVASQVVACKRVFQSIQDEVSIILAGRKAERASLPKIPEEAEEEAEWPHPHTEEAEARSNEKEAEWPYPHTEEEAEWPYPHTEEVEEEELSEDEDSEEGNDDEDEEDAEEGRYRYIE